MDMEMVLNNTLNHTQNANTLSARCESVIRHCIYFHSTVCSGLKCIHSIRCRCACMPHYYVIHHKRITTIKKFEECQRVLFLFFRLCLESQVWHGYKVQWTTETPGNYNTNKCGILCPLTSFARCEWPSCWAPSF